VVLTRERGEDALRLLGLPELGVPRLDDDPGLADLVGRALSQPPTPPRAARSPSHRRPTRRPRPAAAPAADAGISAGRPGTAPRREYVASAQRRPDPDCGLKDQDRDVALRPVLIHAPINTTTPRARATTARLMW
jgi:hypothetical protein